MRVLVILALLTGPMIALGWPSPWVVVCSAFVAGFLARRGPSPPPEPRRPGYLPVDVGAKVTGSVVQRVRSYSDGGLPDPEAFGLPLERPAFGDCEGCGGS